MELSRILKLECIEQVDKKYNKNEILHHISELAANSINNKKISASKIEKKFWEREKLGSTAIAPEIAIPHCRLKNLDNFIMGIITSKNGIKFDSIDNKPTKVIIFILAPEGASTEMIRLLAGISQYLRSKDNISKILNAPTPEAIRQTFLNHTKVNDEPKQLKSHMLINVIIQDENIFDPILEIFTESENTNLVLLDAENAAEYLYHMPLFSSFLENSKEKYCRLISATVETGIADQICKQLDLIINNQPQHSGLLYYTQHIARLNGALQI